MIAALENEESLFWRVPLQLWGPVFLLCTLGLAAKTGIPYDLLALALAGYYLCARWHLRGCAYAQALLGLTMAVKHALIGSNHLWHLGLEGSLGCALFITALAFEQGNFLIESLAVQIETGKASLQNVEEELEQRREEAAAQHTALQEKVGALQKELEETQSEYSSLLILNEVLRKTAARHAQEGAFSLDLQHRIGVLQVELADSQKELARVKASDALAIENQKLMKELNAARHDKEQTHLINETLARLHAKENLRVKESSDRIEAILAEKMQMQERLQAELVASRTEAKIYSGNHEQTAMELQKTRQTLKDFSEIQTQRNFLQERLQSAENEIAVLRQKISQPQPDSRSIEQIGLLEQERTRLTEQLAHAQEKVHSLAQVEPLFKQLKKQFEEKNEILHQTRSQLFKADTELQKLRMERDQIALQFNPLPQEIGQEVEVLDLQIHHLEEENRELQEIITLLSSSEPAPQRKKKVKTPPASDQTLLF